MEKLITVNINGSDELIKYDKSKNDKGKWVFVVQTTGVSVPNFTFVVDGKQVIYIKLGDNRDDIMLKIIKAIDTSEAKR